METFSKALDKRLEALSKIAENNKKEDNAKVDSQVKKLQDKLTRLETTHRKLVTSLNEKHSNHSKEINNKTQNIAGSIENISNRIAHLEAESASLNEKHSNHSKEINNKTQNISGSIETMSNRISHLEVENDSLRKKIDLLMYTQEKLQEDIRRIERVKTEKQVVTVKREETVGKSHKEPVKEVKKETVSAPETRKDAHHKENRSSGLSALNYDDLKKVNLKGNLDEEEKVDEDYVSKPFRKSFVDGIYQAWTGKFARGTKLPEFTITLYGYSFKSSEVTKKHYKELLAEVKKQENHTHEELTRTSEGMLFEKPVNTVLVNNKELEITKAEAVFYVDKKVYDINISFLGNKMSVSDLKTIVGFLVKK